MYNPFPVLTPGLLSSELFQGKRYFVRQFFSRGMDSTVRASFLLRAYKEEESEIAQEHFASLVKDPNSFLYDTNCKEHLEKLQTAASQPVGYRIFYAGHKGGKGGEWKPPTQYQQKMKRYIGSKHSNWRTKKGGPKVEIAICEEYGHLYLEFSFGDEKDIVTLEEIEKF
jgi:hypothetical protein